MLENGAAHSEATLWFDGASLGNPGDGGAGFQLVDDITGGSIDFDAIEITSYYPCSNNQAEYIGLIKGLQCAAREGVRYLKVKGDSELILKQMQGLYNVRSENLKPLYREAKEEEKGAGDGVPNEIAHELFPLRSSFTVGIPSLI